MQNTSVPPVFWRFAFGGWSTSAHSTFLFPASAAWLSLLFSLLMISSGRFPLVATALVLIRLYPVIGALLRGWKMETT